MVCRYIEKGRSNGWGIEKWTAGTVRCEVKGIDKEKWPVGTMRI